MSIVTVSSKYQVVIPEKVRECLGVKPGQKFDVIEYDGCIEFIPVKNMRSLRGSLKGLDTDVQRDKKDRV